MRLTASLIALTLTTLTVFSQTPPPGFSALFNGRDLSGWYGWETKDPALLKAMPQEEQRLYKRRSIEGGLPGKENNEHLKAHWTVENGELVNDGKGLYLTTAQATEISSSGSNTKPYPMGTAASICEVSPRRSSTKATS